MTAHVEPAILFLSYAHEDESLLKELEKHLVPLKRQGLISPWHDRLIEPGTDWAQEVDAQLKRASIFLLLISPDFLASDYCYGIEMHQALERHRTGTAYVIPIILRPADWQETPLRDLQALPPEGKPITSWPDRDEAFDQVTKGIRRVIMALRQAVLVVSSPTDQPFVARFSSDLKTRGILSWSYHTEPKQDTVTLPEESVRQDMQTIFTFLVVLSENTRNSRFVKEQLELAAIYRRPVIVLWIRGDSWEELLPEEWNEQEIIDARGARYEEALQEVLTRIRPREALAFSLVPPFHQLETMGEPRNPYKGLRAFLSEDAQDFFGRDRLIQQILNECQTLLEEEQKGKPASRLLTVIGPSGSGKSSVVMAGILPRLQQDILVGSAGWLFLDRIFPGTAPLEALATSLAKKYAKKDSLAIHQLLESDSSRVLHQLVAEIAPPEGKVLLVIDQFEELFAQAVSEEERLHFLDLLMTATQEVHGPLICILTLRADFFGHVMECPQFYPCINIHRFDVLSLDLHELREAIEKPAALPDVQLDFENNLVSDLLFETRSQAGALPLLQFTLDQLYQRRRGHTLTYQAYEEIGGVRGGLLKQAEDTYTSLSTDEQRKMAQAVFLRLVNLGESEHTLDFMRRRAFLTEFALDDPTQTRQMQEVIEAFTRARLLTANQDGGKTTLEISHEAVLYGWPRLSDWLRTARRALSIQQAISRDAVAWEHHGKSRDRLYRGSQLKEAQEWASRNLPSKQEAAFLSASHTARIQFLVSLLVLCTVLITSTGLAGWFFLTRPPDPTYVTTLKDGGIGSLRWAIENVSQGSTIRFASNLRGTIILQGNLEIDRSVTIQGPDTHLIAISTGHQGDQSWKVHIFQESSVTISHLVFKDSIVAVNSLIYNQGRLNLIDCIVSNNIARSKSHDDPTTGNGGGIYNTGILTLTKTIVSNNQADKDGGGIYNTGVLTLNHTTVSGNKATGTDYGPGGGIYNAGILTLNYTAILGNMANDGGGIASECIDNTSFGILCKDSGSIATLTLMNSVVSHNSTIPIPGEANSEGGGGGIFDTGKFTMTNSIVSSNRASDGGGVEIDSQFAFLFTNSTISGNSIDSQSVRGGAGIYDYGEGADQQQGIKSSLTLINCTVTGNTASGDGGGIYTALTTLKLINTTVSGNITRYAPTTHDTSFDGGGLLNFEGISLLVNSTISGNTAYQDGGGIYNQGGIIYIYFSTIVGNTAQNGGGLGTINVEDENFSPPQLLIGHTLLQESILVGNKADKDPNARGALVSGGYNLIQDMSMVNISESRFPGSDISVSDQDLTTLFPMGAQLRDNGGPTQTYALLAEKDNPALDKVPLAYCHSTDSWHSTKPLLSAPITTDQRGKPRPDGKEGMCDIGAYEAQN
jgi:hypothetical protein